MAAAAMEISSHPGEFSAYKGYHEPTTSASILPLDPELSFCYEFCYKKMSSTPFYFKLDRVWEDDLLLERVEKNQPSYDKYKEYDFEALVKNQVLETIWEIHEETWLDIRHNYPAHLKQAIQLAATLFFMLLPKHNLCIPPRCKLRATQLNELWEKLIELPNLIRNGQLSFFSGSPFGDACVRIMQLLASDTEKFSILTETDVSAMLKYYHAILQRGAPYSTPYKVCGSGVGTIEDVDQWFKDIMEVVDKMEPPPILKADDHTRVLCKIASGEADAQWLMSTLNLKLFPYSGGESTPLLLKKAFDYFVEEVIRMVKGEITCYMRTLLEPLFHLYPTFSWPYHHVAPEIVGLINVADVRRTVLESRFIRRSHLLWAFYECGHVLPPHIRKDITLKSVDEDHPPYHIYMAAVKLAQSCRENVRLENFIFAVIYSKDICVDGDQVIKLKWLYKGFLEDLNNFDSSHRSLKRLFSGDFKYDL